MVGINFQPHIVILVELKQINECINKQSESLVGSLKTNCSTA